MATVIPAIIPKSLSDLTDHLFKIREVTRSVQVDIVDGKFVPFTSWPFFDERDIGALASVSNDFEIEVDLMIMKPEETIQSYIEAGISAAVIHIESTDHAPALIPTLRAAGVRVGLSLLNSTPLSVLDEYLGEIDYVQLMGIADIGTQGQPFDERVLDRAGALRATHPKIPLSVDGGVNADTIVRLKEAGITRFVSGSAIFHDESPSRAYIELETLVQGNQ